jgi:exodeoxyribonuclease VII large subunit
LRQLSQRLAQAKSRDLAQRQSRLGGLVRALEAVGPVATLDRGYAIVTRAADGQLIRASDQVTIGEEINTRLASGNLGSKITRRS